MSEPLKKTNALKGNDPMGQGDNWYGWKWATPPGMKVFLHAVEDAYRGHHLNPDYVNVHRWWMLDYFYTPSRVKVRDGTWHDRPALTAHLYPPIVPIQEDTTRAKAVPHHTWASFLTSDSEFVSRFSGPTSGYTRILDPDLIIGETLCTMAAIAHVQKGDSFWAVQTMLTQLLDSFKLAHVVSEDVCVMRKPGYGRINPIVGTALSYMQAHISDPIAIKDVARHMRISPSTLAHRYIRETGEGMMTSLRRLRLIRAKVLLTKGYKLDLVVGETGFYDRSHFVRTFRQAEGVSPSGFLKKLARRTARQ